MKRKKCRGEARELDDEARGRSELEVEDGEVGNGELSR